MDTKAGSTASNALPRGKVLQFRLEERSGAPAQVVYDILADVATHADWGGQRQSKRFRLTSIEAPQGPAQVGTEFSSTGYALDGSWRDQSVVTEARRPSLFEFVTEGAAGEGDDPVVWTLVHRYEISPDGRGSRVIYTSRVTSITRLEGGAKMLVRPVIGPLMLKVSGSFSRKGLRAMARMAEERTGAEEAKARPSGEMR